MATSEAQKKYAKKHFEKLDTITIRPVKGTKERWRKYAQRTGQSLTQFIMDAVEVAIMHMDED